eukprot:2904723-Pleurochrysis_carterae.AAC.1
MLQLRVGDVVAAAAATAASASASSSTQLAVVVSAKSTKTLRRARLCRLRRGCPVHKVLYRAVQQGVAR